MRPALLVVSFVAGLSFAQSPVRNIAPPPSDRFPARWYPADNNVTSTEAPVKGAPYSATMATVFHHPADRDGATETRVDSPWYRDGEGRTRTEQSSHGLYHSADGVAHDYVRREIGVNDPVSHCNFTWTEPVMGNGPSIAIVRCEPRTLSYTSSDRFASIVAQKAASDSRGRTEPLGHRVIEGFDAVGARRVVTSLDKNDKTEHVFESWYSPELHEMLRFGTATPVPLISNFELHDIHLGEPDPSLFYPPAAYHIVKQGDPLP